MRFKDTLGMFGFKGQEYDMEQAADSITLRRANAFTPQQATPSVEAAAPQMAEATPQEIAPPPEPEPPGRKEGQTLADWLSSVNEGRSVPFTAMGLASDMPDIVQKAVQSALSDEKLSDAERMDWLTIGEKLAPDGATELGVTA